MSLKPIYRKPNPEEKKAGAIAVRNADGALFDGKRFIRSVPACEPVSLEPMTAEEEELEREWISRLGVAV